MVVRTFWLDREHDYLMRRLALSRGVSFNDLCVEMVEKGIRLENPTLTLSDVRGAKR